MSDIYDNGGQSRYSSIRSHRKSRAGCKTCKRRKIRCDENKPECYNCVKRAVHCDFSATSATPSASSSVYPPSSCSNEDVSLQDQHLKHRLPGGEMVQPLSMLDLELMHNFSTSTAYTLNDDSLMCTLFRTSIPKLCLRHPFLMRALLAVSALHVAHYTPSRLHLLVDYAVQQHQAASKTATVMLSEMTDDTCIAMYIFSVLTYVFAMASPSSHDTDDILLVTDDFGTEWVHLLRGSRAIVDISEETLKRSEFSPIFEAGHRRFRLRLVDQTPHQPLSDLLSFLEGTIKSKSHLDTYSFVIEELRKTFSVIGQVMPGQLNNTDTSIWLFQITDEYLALLKAKDNAALTILAYFCVLLKQMERYWWISGRSEHILGSIYRLIDNQHRLLLRWPMEEIGWMPPQD